MMYLCTWNQIQIEYILLVDYDEPLSHLLHKNHGYLMLLSLPQSSVLQNEAAGEHF